MEMLALPIGMTYSSWSLEQDLQRRSNRRCWDPICLGTLNVVPKAVIYVLHGFSIVTSECWRVLAAVLACWGWDRGDWGRGYGDMLATPLIPPTTAGVSLPMIKVKEVPLLVKYGEYPPWASEK